MNMHYDRSQGKVPRRQALIAGLLVMALAGPSLAQSRPIAKVWKDPSCGCCRTGSHTCKAQASMCRFSTPGTPQRARGWASRRSTVLATRRRSAAMPSRVMCLPRTFNACCAKPRRPSALAAPGMPVGSPGMDGPAYGGRKDAYDVLLIGKTVAARSISRIADHPSTFSVEICHAASAHTDPQRSPPVLAIALRRGVLIIAAVAAYFLLRSIRHMLPAISPSCCWRLVR